MLRRNKQSGNALAELVLLLPIYVLVILGVLYIGDLTGIRTRLQPTVEQAAVLPGTMSAQNTERRLFGRYLNHRLARDNDPDAQLSIRENPLSQYPTATDIRDALEYLADPPETPYAHGSWVFRDGQLVPAVEVDYRRGTGDSRARSLLDEDQPEILAQTLLGWMHEASARAEFKYDPGYMRMNLAVIDVDITDAVQELEAKHKSFVRGERERSVDNDGQSHPIEAQVLPMLPEGRPMDDYPDFRNYSRDLWLPDARN